MPHVGDYPLAKVHTKAEGRERAWSLPQTDLQFHYRQYLPEKDVTFDKFCERVQVHGLLDWHQAKTMFAKGFWLIWMIIFLIVLIVGVVMSVKEFYTNPIKTTVSVTTNDTLWFPDVYLCPMNSFIDLGTDSREMEHIRRFLRRRNYTSLLGDTYSVWSQILPEIKARPPPDFSRGSSGQEPLPPPTIRNFKHLLERVSYTVAKLIPLCEFEGQTIDCAKITEPMVDKDGSMCYKISVNRPQRAPGVGLRILVDLQLSGRFGTPPPIDGLFFSIDKYIDPFAAGQYVAGPGQYVKANLDVGYNELVTVTYSDTPQICKEDGTYTFGVLKGPYTDTMCSVDCAQQVAIQDCGCLLMVDPTYVQERYLDMEFCDKDSMPKCVEPFHRNDRLQSCSRQCYKSCKSWSIDARLTSMALGSQAAIDQFAAEGYRPISNGQFAAEEHRPFPNGQFAARGGTPFSDLANPVYWRDNVILFDISYAKHQYTSVIQSHAKTLAELVSDIGGQTGLWLGCSVFTAIQFVALIVGYCYTKSRG